MAIKRRVILDTIPAVSTKETPVTKPSAPLVLTPDAFEASLPPPVIHNEALEGVPVAGKFRRLKDSGVAKVSRFERDLCPSDRDTIIRWWNANQRLIPKDDPVCVTLANEINTQPGLPLSALQVAGYFSYLCRLGQMKGSQRAACIARGMRRGKFSTTIAYSRPLLDAIVQNWEREREDERLRAQAHAQLRAARAAGQAIRIRSGDGVRAVIRPTATPVQAPAPVPVAPTEETFDIKWM
jgi:hypothetical protein